MNYDQWLKQQARPVTVAQPQSSGINFLPLVINVVLVAVVAWLILGRANSPGPQPPDPPQPTVDVVEIVEKATRQYAENLARVFDTMADKVASEEINSRADALEFAKTYTLAARTNAFAPIDQMDNDQLPEGDWSNAKDAVVFYLREKAKGHARAGE